MTDMGIQEVIVSAITVVININFFHDFIFCLMVRLSLIKLSSILR